MWYHNRSPEAAVRFDAAIAVALRAIQRMPESWTACDDRHRFYTLKRFPYLIIYRVDDGNIVIVAVAHSSRSSVHWQNRD